MSRRHRRKSIELGEAISLEDALSVMVVIFVLFVLFMVPLVNLGKLQMDSVQTDPFWEKSWQWVQLQKGKKALEYRTALGFDDSWKMNTENINQKTWIYAASPDSILWVFSINPNGHFDGVKVEKFQTALMFRKGKLKYSSLENEFFISHEIPHIELDSSLIVPEFKSHSMETRGF